MIPNTFEHQVCSALDDSPPHLAGVRKGNRPAVITHRAVVFIYYGIGIVRGGAMVLTFHGLTSAFLALLYSVVVVLAMSVDRIWVTRRAYYFGWIPSNFSRLSMCILVIPTVLRLFLTVTMFVENVSP